MKNIKGLMIIALTFILAPCVSIPENIKGNNQPGIQKSFISVRNQPGLYTGQQTRLGDKIINVINTKNDTLPETTVLSLNDSAKPQVDASYQGHILAQQKGFLDPVNYENHFITILGTTQGDESGFINKAPYNSVKVDLQGIQVWCLTGSANTTYNMWDYGYGAFWPESIWGVPYYVSAVTQVTPELVKQLQR